MVKVGVEDIPEVTYEYYGLVEFMIENLGMYSMDNKRTDCHILLCQHYRISPGMSRGVTDNLNKYKDVASFHLALVNLEVK